ncbi:MAG: beta-N-acetylhexosaminidase [Armatimonadetes bacterium]|nr:beta-N-acetylhexosaminidase [Armatimonadota bacterium]
MAAHGLRWAWLIAAAAAAAAPVEVADVASLALAARQIPAPRELTARRGEFALRGVTVPVSLPAGAAHEACREVLGEALQALGARVQTAPAAQGNRFSVGRAVALAPLPTEGQAEQGYALAVTGDGIAATAASPTGLLYAAETLRQLARLSRAGGRLPALTIRDSPQLRYRGIYVEGGQERYGRIVDADYLIEQIQRLAELKMNLLVIECYNLFPYASFPACADAGTLSRADCERIFAAAHRWHVTLMPSLQTLAQAWELVWGNEGGTPYREATAPGLICPSNPDVYPFIKALYRDLLTWFDETPLLGIGCSEIDMQWQSRYCPRCRARVDQGETVRDLLLGHAEKCIRAVDELAKELGRPVRPMMWGDEFYMYGPGRDWVGLERIPKHTVMGYWKYWPDYAGIGGLLERGYDVLGISAIYNHCFYLADISPDDPPKVWPPLAQTGVANIDGMVRDAAAAARAHPGNQFLGVATASFSKHRLRAFDSLWYGFALNGHCTWSGPPSPLPEWQGEFTRAFVDHWYDAHTDASATALAEAWERLDRCKSRLELANQTFHDVVGVYDTQEPNYQGNSLLGAWQRCRELLGPDGKPPQPLADIRAAAVEVARECSAIERSLDAQRVHVGRGRELGELWQAAHKIRSHAERQALMIDAQQALAEAPGLNAAEVRRRLTPLARGWQANRVEVERILESVEPLCRQGDPCGFRALLRDVAAIGAHLTRMAASGPDAASAPGNLIVDETFAALDPARWVVMGEPKLVDGHLETRATGGWERYCGLLSQVSFALEADRPLVVEFELTPLQIGIDSQLFASATQPNGISFRFAMAGPRDRFAVHTQSQVELGGDWLDPAAGWKLRGLSPEVKVGETYQIHGEITRRTWRITIRSAGQGPWDMPFWESGAVPMDELPETRLVFADVEPEGGTAASRWGPIRIWRAGG